MTLIALVVAALVGASALAKIRVDIRLGVGVGLPTLAELAVGVAAAVQPLTPLSLAPWFVVLAFAVSVASSVAQLRRYRAIRRRREASEGGRLAAYVRYLSPPDSEDSEPGGPEPGP